MITSQNSTMKNGQIALWSNTICIAGFVVTGEIVLLYYETISEPFATQNLNIKLCISLVSSINEYTYIQINISLQYCMCVLEVTIVQYGKYILIHVYCKSVLTVHCMHRDD